MPCVSIGLPVYNGENFVTEAIKSVLDQTFTDFELIVSDNHSSDRTEEICRAFQASDSRVRYFRNEKNLGAAPNYNIAWQHAAGKYFKWLAHDDALLPQYLENTVRALDENPDAVLCNTTAIYIDQNGDELGAYRSPLAKASSDKPSERLAAMILDSHTCIDFFGLLRHSATENSILHQAYSGADKAFLAQMALRGRLLQIEPAQVQMREHPQRYTRVTATARMKLAWHDSNLEHKRDIPILTLYRACRDLVESEALSDADRTACRRVLRQFWTGSWNGARLVTDVLSVPFPGLVSKAFDLKFRLFGAPGNFHR
ncbi:MAG TPA: glycosyltransferase family 2 protein [Kiloniellaceae bacterium]|nr:glycosyltransferase family 2 protein [Kiloniellaceae bacterium]